MASVFYGQNRGTDDANPEVVTVGASTGSTDVELRIDTGKGLTRNEVRNLVDNILNRMIDGRNTSYPPI